MTKRSAKDFAINGGSPLFDKPLHVGQLFLPSRRRLESRIDMIYKSGWMTNNGPMVQEFEERISAMTDTAHCVSVANGTLGLMLLARALDLKGEVILPSFTFVATAHSIYWQGARPRFCDIDRNTHNLSPEKVVEALTDETTAILGVHVWGRPCAPEALQDIATRCRIPLIYDAAHAFGCVHSKTPIGNFGVAEVFSFHATKVMNCCEGGAITTNDAALAAELRDLRNFGFQGMDNISGVGINAKLSEIQAAWGLCVLDEIDEIVMRNKEIYFGYRDQLEGIPGIRCIPLDEDGDSNYQYVVLEITDDFSLSRDELLQLLWAENILARRYFYPGIHQMSPYRDDCRPPTALVDTERLTRQVLQMPSGRSCTIGAIAEICNLIKIASA
jgi:dTDP-4-amino-4,6-dideoxygalactose transaminase